MRSPRELRVARLAVCLLTGCEAISGIAGLRTGPTMEAGQGGADAGRGGDGTAAVGGGGKPGAARGGAAAHGGSSGAGAAGATMGGTGGAGGKKAAAGAGSGGGAAKAGASAGSGGMGGAANSGSAPRFCERQSSAPLSSGKLIRCDDFELTPGPVWTNPTPTEGAQIARDAAFGLDSDASLRAVLTQPVPANQNPGGSARFETSFPVDATRKAIHAAAAVYPDDVAYNTGHIWFLTLRFDGLADGAYYMLMLAMSENESGLWEYYSNPFKVTALPQNAALPARAWTNVLMDLDLSETMAKARLAVDGARVNVVTLSITSAELKSAELVLQAGINNATGIAHASLHLDNLALWSE